MSDFDFALYGEDITENLSSAKEKIQKWRDNQETDASTANAAKKEADKILKDVETNLNTYKEELDGLPSGEEKEQHAKQYKRMKKNFDDAKANLANKEPAKPKPKVVADPEPEPKKKNNNDSGDAPAQQMKKYEKGDNAMLDETIDISNDTVKELENIKKLNENTIEVGTEAAIRLKAQTEKMKKIRERLDDLGEGTKRANKELNAFMRSVACDKVIILIVILVVLVAGVLIGLRIAFPKLFQVDFASAIQGVIKGNSTSFAIPNVQN